MYEARQRDMWEHTSLLAGLIHNGACSKAEDTVDNTFYNPFYKKEKKKEKQEPRKPNPTNAPTGLKTSELLQAVFCGVKDGGHISDKSGTGVRGVVHRRRQVHKKPGEC